MPDQATLDFLRDELPARLKLKNISCHPEAGKVSRMEADEPTTARVTNTLRSHLNEVGAFLARFTGDLTQDARVGTCSFRPIEEKGRNLKPHASNELVHIDAGANGATDSDRILRFFVNVSRDRVWATKGNFDNIVDRYGTHAGRLDETGRLAACTTTLKTMLASDPILPAIRNSASRRTPPGWYSLTMSATQASKGNTHWSRR